MDRYILALLAWILIFAWQALNVGVQWSRSARLAERIEARGQILSFQAKELSSLHRLIQAQDGEMRFLQNLPELLPKDKGYLRTQKVISDDVQALRRKLAPKLKGVLHVLVDAKANKLYVKRGFQLLWQADCSVGRGGVLVDRRTGRRWEFVTPRGEFRVIGKTENPKWRKPDWAYAETGEPPPPPDDPKRLVEGELGAYLLNLGDGYLIHGTKKEALLGRPASHGCVRLGAADLKKLYDLAPTGTRVYIFY
ncbi:MAG: L,D-transpeptidase [Elusimicrobia bacterium]|nr:L,D-transpeptidase [Elusimicrobiota bacterium]